MDSFSRNIGSIDVLCEFYDVNLCVLVEDEADKYFWDKIFDKFLNSKTIEFESITTCSFINKLGRGCTSLKEFEDELEVMGTNNVKFIIARDSDYSILESNRFPKNRVIMTYGYTQENTLFCPYRIARLICNEVPLRNSDYLGVVESINNWYHETCLLLNEMLKWNIAANIYKSSDEKVDVPSIMGRTSDMYHNKGVLKFSEIEKQIYKARQIVPIDYYNIASEKIIESNLELRYLVSGHFWESLITDKVKKEVLKYRRIQSEARPGDSRISHKCIISSNEILKRCSHKCFERCPNRAVCMDFDFLKKQFDNLVI